MRGVSAARGHGGKVTRGHGERQSCRAKVGATKSRGGTAAKQARPAAARGHAGTLACCEADAEFQMAGSGPGWQVAGIFSGLGSRQSGAWFRCSGSGSGPEFCPAPVPAPDHPHLRPEGRDLRPENEITGTIVTRSRPCLHSAVYQIQTSAISTSGCSDCLTGQALAARMRRSRKSSAMPAGI